MLGFQTRPQASLLYCWYKQATFRNSRFNISFCRSEGTQGWGGKGGALIKTGQDLCRGKLPSSEMIQRDVFISFCPGKGGLLSKPDVGARGRGSGWAPPPQLLLLKSLPLCSRSVAKMFEGRDWLKPLTVKAAAAVSLWMHLSFYSSVTSQQWSEGCCRG